MKSRRFHVKKVVNMSRSIYLPKGKVKPGEKAKGTEKEDPKKEETRGQTKE